MVRGDALGDRMKGYERASRLVLPRRMPVILRVDGKAFHTVTRECERPFDMRLSCAMDEAATYLCKEVQGAALAYVQSDEISVLVHNYRRLTSEAWFDNGVQKMASVAASAATWAFTATADMLGVPVKGATLFDARVFVLPEAEVCNYFVWRQQDATRNSIQMMARARFSHRECNNKNTAQLQDMIHAAGDNWNNLPTRYKRGRCVVRVASERAGVVRHEWVMDQDPPIFSRDREYVERHLATEGEQATDAEAAS